MPHFSTRRTALTLGLAALSLGALAPASHAAASTLTEVFSLPFTFTPSVPVGSPDTFIYTFGSPSDSGVTSQLVASNFTYDSNYQVDENALLSDDFQEYLSGLINYTTDANNQVSSITLNNGATAYVPFSSVGAPASLTLSYYDAPTATPFTLQEQYKTDNAAVTKTLLSGTFNSNGTFTPSVTPAVPESSSLALLALGALPLLGVARRRAARR